MKTMALSVLKAVLIAFLVPFMAVLGLTAGFKATTKRPPTLSLPVMPPAGYAMR